jgi:hypothetical protein
LAAEEFELQATSERHSGLTDEAKQIPEVLQQPENSTTVIHVVTSLERSFKPRRDYFI